MTYQVPLSIHEDLVGDAAEDDPTLGEISGALRDARTAAEAAANAANVIIADKTVTPANNQLRIKSTSWAHFERVSPRLDAVRQRAEAEIERLEKSTLPPAPTPAKVALHSEIRTALRALKHDERAKVVSAAIRAGDAEIIAAIAHASPFLLGISAEERDGELQEWRQRHHAETLRRIERIRKAHRALTNGHSALLHFVAGMVDNELVRQAEASAAAAAKAIEASRAA